MIDSPPLRALVAVDINNLWHSCQQIYGLSHRVDYKAVQELIGNLASKSSNVKWIAYAVSTPTPTFRSQKFVANLEKMGFLVKTRQMRREKRRARGWDVGLAVDAMAWIDEYDIFYLASGDGDLAPLLKMLKKRGKRIEVITFKYTTSNLFYELADRITFLGKNEIFKD